MWAIAVVDKKIYHLNTNSLHRVHLSKSLTVSRTIASALMVFLFTIVCTLLPARPTVCARNGAGWKLAWSDEFNGPDGSGVDSTKWTFDLGGKGWGNNELETYTNRTANARVEKGSLVIKAIKETFTGADNITRDYTSARVLTK